MIYSRSSVIWGEDYDPLDPAKVTTFVKLPYPQVLGLAKGQSSALTVLIELAWLYFENHKNPVRFKGSRLHRNARKRGLEILEREKWINVKQERGKAPLVTLRWVSRPSPLTGKNHH
jgi:hypothetical protein